MEILFETYFSKHAEELLAEKKMSKADFAKEMGILPQNIKKLFNTNNVQILSKVSEVLDIPVDYLINGSKEKTDIDGFVEVGSVVHRIKSKEDLEALLKILL